jgi:O-antigen/teichoic acid export membrane protein
VRSIAHTSARSDQRLLSVAARPFARSVAGVAGANSLITLAGSIGGLLLARYLGPAARGHLVTIVIWPALIGTLASLGTTEATCYLIARSKRDEGPPIIATAAAAALATGLVVAVTGIGLASLIGRTEDVTNYLRFALALAPAYICGGVMTSALQARSIARWNVARGTQPVVYLVGIALLAIAGHLTLGSAVAVFCGAQLAQLTSGAMLVHRTFGRWSPVEPRRLRPLYRFGLQSSIASVPHIINVRLDQLLLSVLPAVSSASLGNYAVAASLSWLALPLATAFGSVAFPAIAGARTEAAARHVERASLLGGAVTAAAVMVVLALTADLIVPALFGPGFDDAIVVLRLLTPGTIFLALNRLLGDLIRGRGQPMAVSYAEGFGAVITITLLLALIPPLGINGAAIASSVAYASVTVLLSRALRRIRRGALAEERRTAPAESR